MKLGIIGLPNVGKSTLFNSLTKSKAESANYPYSTVTPNVGTVSVPDYRLKPLADLYKTEKIVPASIEFVDIAGLAKGASKGEGLGNKFLAVIREVDAIVHVVRCFENPDVIGDIDVEGDIETINLELIFSDLEMLERRLAKAVKAMKSDKSAKIEADLVKKIMAELENGICARLIELSDDEKELADTFDLLTTKPILYAANVGDADLENDGESSPHVQKLREISGAEGSEFFVVCAKLEAELVELDDDEKQMFLEEMGSSKSGLDLLISASYSLLGLISFLTAGPKEVRAWTIRKGTKAQMAAGKIHSDIARGFIRAEIVNYDDLINLQSYTKAKESGLVRLEGKEYIVKDSDVILFRFNV